MIFRSHQPKEKREQDGAFPASDHVLALAGNPNVGKSVLFQRLTGRYVAVSNYPGTTVDTTAGLWKGRPVLDTPGVYALSSFSDEERVARDLLLRTRDVINVLEARHLQRDLLLTLQLIDMGKNMLVCVNMLDELRKSGQTLDLQKLERELGVPVVGITAVTGEGLPQLEETIPRMRKGIKTPETVRLLPQCPQTLTESEKILYLEDDVLLCEKKRLPIPGKLETIYRARAGRAQHIAETVCTKPKGEDRSERLSRLLLRPIPGTLFLLIGLLISFLFVCRFIAGTVVDFTQDTLMDGYAVPLIRRGFSHLHRDGLLYQVLCGEYGLCTLFPTYLLALLLPLMMGFTFLLSLWEDSGCLPRACVLLDGAMNRIGLSGRAFLPLLTGFGCVTAGAMSARLLPTQKERHILSALLGLFIPCSAQTGILLAVLTPLGPKAWLLYLLWMGIGFVLCGRILQRLAPGDQAPLLLDLPRLRLPRLSNVLRKTLHKTFSFLQDAAPLFALGCLLLSLSAYVGALDNLCTLLAPFMHFIGLPADCLPVLLMGVIRKDFGAAGLKSLISLGKLGTQQVFIALLLLSLSLPCVSSIFMFCKEQGLRFTLRLCIAALILTVLTGLCLNRLFLWLPLL